MRWTPASVQKETYSTSGKGRNGTVAEQSPAFGKDYSYTFDFGGFREAVRRPPSTPAMPSSSSCWKKPCRSGRPGACLQRQRRRRPLPLFRRPFYGPQSLFCPNQILQGQLLTKGPRASRRRRCPSRPASVGLGVTSGSTGRRGDAGWLP